MATEFETGGGCLSEELAAAFVARELAEPDEERVHDHLDDCAECRASIFELARLRAAVEHTRPDSAAGLAAGSGEPDLAVDAPLGPGVHIGRYVLERRVGSGGMGHVYAARDPKLGREIALKLIRPGMATDVNRARLLREARALAKVSHENVIAIHDAGEEFDRVFIAMELVKGDTARGWLGDGRPWREVLDAYVAAGRGLATAHDAGIVHRDFKPDNVLVGDDGRVRVTDFGLARDDGGEPSIYDPEGDEPTPATALGSQQTALTAQGSLVGTPLYMSPEQYGKGDIDARSDQFSFCASLYEALSGQRAFSGETVADLKAQITRGEVREPPPGAAVPKRVWAAIKRGLSPDPADRYPSMLELIAALSAATETRRGMWLVGGAIAAVAAAAIGWALFVNEDESPCDVGQERFADVWNDTVKSELEGKFAAAGPYGSGTFAATAPVIDGYIDDWLAGRQSACRDTHELGEQSEQVLDVRMLCLSRGERELSGLLSAWQTIDKDGLEGAAAAARSLAPVAACADRDSLSAQEPLPADPDVRAEIESITDGLAAAASARAAGRYKQALAAAEPLATRAAATGYRPLEGEALLLIGMLQHDLGDDKTADTTFANAARAAEAGRADRVRLLAQVHRVDSVGRVLAQHDRAAEIAADSTSLLERLGEPDELAGRHELALGRLERARGKYDRAHELLVSARQRLERSLGAEHPLVLAATSSLARVFSYKSDSKSAYEMYKWLVDKQRSALGDTHPSVGKSLANLSLMTTRHLSDDKKSRELAEQALAILEPALGRDHATTLSVKGNYAMSFFYAGDYEKSLAINREVLASRVRTAGKDHPSVGNAYMSIGRNQLVMGKTAEAVTSLREAVRIRAAALGAEHPATGVAHNMLGQALTYDKQYDEAEKALTVGLDIAVKTTGPEHVDVGYGENDLCSLLLTRGDPRAALARCQRALPILEKALGEKHRDVSYALVGIGKALTELGRAKAALPHLERALTLRTTTQGLPRETPEARFELARALRATGAKAKAKAEGEKALAEYEAIDTQKEQATAVRQWLAKP